MARPCQAGLTLMERSVKFGRRERAGRGRLRTFGIIVLGAVWGAGVLGLTGCAVSRTSHVAPSQVPLPPMNASAAELIADINSQSKAVRTLSATVDLAPTAGSVYSGVIRQYHDVRGFILAKWPGWIRIQGQAPVVRTDIFDMASDGQKFQLYIPSKQKFIVGSTAPSPSPKSSLENLRPQHIVEALLLEPVDTPKDQYFIEEAEEGSQRFYVVGILGNCSDGRLYLERKIWFDRVNLSISRVQLYGAKGRYQEDIHYSFYEDFGGVRFPRRIEVDRPVEDYSLSMTIESATFNQDIPASKFVLQQPATAQLVVLKTPPAPAGGACGQ